MDRVEKFNKWWAEQCVRTYDEKENPNGVAIGCLLNPDGHMDGPRRYVV